MSLQSHQAAHDYVRRSSLELLSIFLLSYPVKEARPEHRETWRKLVALADLAEVSLMPFRTRYRVSPNRFEDLSRGVADMPRELIAPFLEFLDEEIVARTKATKRA